MRTTSLNVLVADGTMKAAIARERKVSSRALGNAMAKPAINKKTRKQMMGSGGRAR